MQSENTFEEYLRAHKLRERTVRGHLQDLERFKKWSEGKNLHLDKASYNDLLSFVQEAQQRGVSNSSINIHLNSIEKYYDYLSTGMNPAKGLRIKNTHKKVLQHLLNSEHLEELYQSYLNRPEWTFKGEIGKELHTRNAVMLGLMIFQGADTPTLKKLEISHIHLSKGTVYIPSTSRSNGRVLKLHTLQILPIQKFFLSLEKPSEKLFTCNLTHAIFWLMSTLKQDQIKNVYQIRSNVLVNWLKIHNIRQVQYMAGHKHISSTERYKEEDLESLQQQVNKFHPLK